MIPFKLKTGDVIMTECKETIVKIAKSDLNYFRCGIQVGKLLYKNETHYYAGMDLADKSLMTEMPVDQISADVRCNLFPTELLLPLFQALDDVFLSEGDKNEFQAAHTQYRKYKEMRCNEKKLQVYADYGTTLPAIDVVTYEGKPVAVIMLDFETSILAMPGFEDLDVIRDWDRSGLSKSGRGVRYVGDIPVTMRDGIRLVGSLYLPADLKEDEKIPTIYYCSPYNRKLNPDWIHLYCDRGYACYIQDVRATGDSEGDFAPMLDADLDGSDTLDWIVSQPWSNGRVGTQGSSYGGFWQLHLMPANHPALRCTIPMNMASTQYHAMFRRFGSINLATIPWLITIAGKANPVIGYIEHDYFSLFKEKPFIKTPKKILGFTPEFMKMMAEHPDRDDFWAKDKLEDRLKEVDIPTMMITGLWDSECTSDAMIWDTINSGNYTNRKIFIGPWAHFFNGRRTLGTFTCSNDGSLYNFEMNYFKWYDRWLKDMQNGIEKPIVTYYVTGENQWHQADSFPPKESKKAIYYFGGNGKAATDLESGTLSLTKTIIKGSDAYQYDPENPIITDTTPDLFGRFVTPNPFNDIEARQDVLTYTSEPLEEDVTFVGRPEVTLYASSSAPDTDWIARVTVVDRNGQSIRLSEHLLPARYRNSFEKSEYLTPGEIYEFKLTLPFISYRYKAGERVRIEISSSNGGLFLPNTNTAENPFYATNTQVAINTIHYGEKYPTNLTVNILK